MAHIVEQLANAIVAALTDVTEAGDNVSHRRFIPSPAGTSADIIVYSDLHDIGDLNQSGALERIIPFKVQARLSGNKDTLESRGYALEVAVEEALMADRTLGGLAVSLTPTLSQTEADNSGEKPHLIKILTYTALAHTLAGSPETPH